MKTRVRFALVACLLLLPVVSTAQTKGAARGIAPFTTPAPRTHAPERPRADRPARPAPDAGRDPFRARPWTYQPRFDRVPHGHFQKHLFFPPSFGFAGPVYAPWPSWAGSGTPEPSSEPAPAVHVRPDPEPARTQPYTPGSPGRAKTLYVIRGCYAGDVPPAPGDLPDGCHAADVRAIPPRRR
jgi:hypothetical protein